MHTIRVQLDTNGYDIIVGSGVLGDLAVHLKPLVTPSRIMIVTNPIVNDLYGERVREALSAFPCDVVTETIPDGEEHKNMETIHVLLDKMVDARLDRKSMLVSVGGGVVGDIAGFAAAIYMRGIPYIQIPTTLLAQVDSSIGGKVGVDHPKAKNLIGAFYQPVLVCIDPAVLKTLPEKHVRNGMSEIIKYGVIADEGLFTLLERKGRSLQSLDGGLLEDVIRRCCQIKARVVQQDARETYGIREILNYGHTVGHAIESVTGYTRFTHGEAVAIGMMAAVKIARLMKLATGEVEDRQQKLLAAVGLSTTLADIELETVVEATRLDKKTVGGSLRFVVPMSIGRVVVKDNIPVDVVEKALSEVMAPERI